jgi:DNA-directed RNA polymerase I, II, and III subunit RPABC1
VIVGMAQDYQLEEFAEADLLVNITQHTLVPQHEILTTEEKRLLLER